MKTCKMAVLSAAVAGSLWSLDASAQFNYNSGDLLLGIQNGGSSDLVVDIGSASLYTGATGPITVSGTYFTYGQLTAALGGTSLDGLYFSVFGDNASVNTLWATRAAGGSAWTAQSYLAQGNTGSKIDAVGNSASDYASLPNHFGPNNTATALVEPSGLGVGNPGGDASLTVLIGSGNFNTFEGNMQTVTPAGFTASSTPDVANLYQLVSTTDINGNSQAGAGSTLLGSFSLGTDGSLVFNPVAVPEPTTLGLCGAGMLVLTLVRRMKRNQ
jgi:hypothetical protein